MFGSFTAVAVNVAAALIFLVMAVRADDTLAKVLLVVAARAAR
jgi:hypothetical protein